MRWVADWIVERPKSILAALSVLTAVAAWSATGLRFDFSPQSVYRGQDAFVDFSERHKAMFGHEDAVLLVVLEATGENDVFAPDALFWQRRLGDRLRTLSRVQSVEGLAFLQSPRVGRFEPFVRDTRPDRTTVGRLRRFVFRRPLLREVLVSEDGRLTTLAVRFDPAAREMADTRAVVESVREILRRNPAPAGFTTSLTGISALRVDVVESLQADQFVMFPLCAGLFLVVVIAMFRNLKITLFALASVFCGVVWAFGIVAATGGSFSLLSNIVPTLTLIIGAANVVHIVARYVDYLQEFGEVRKADAARATVSEMSWTCLLTFLTTAIGFGSLLVSQSQILQQFAWQAAIALVCEYFSVVLILGCGLAVTDSLSATAIKADRVTRRLVGFASGVVATWPRRVLVCSLAIVVGCAFYARDLEVNSFLYETFDAEHPAMQTIRRVDEKLSGLAPLEIQLSADNEDALFDPRVFERVQELQDELRRRDDVRFARSYVDLFLLAGTTGQAVDADTIARLRRNVRRAGQVAGREFFISDDDRTARILIRIRDTGSARMNQLIDELQLRLRTLFPSELRIRTQITGDAFLHARCMDQFVRDLFYSLLTASVAIFSVIALLFRSVRTGLISAVPNLTPLTVTLGYLAWRAYPLTAGTVIVFAITLGIAVDDTIHFLSRFRDERRRQKCVREAVAAVFQSSGRAIILTTVLIVSGLSVLLLSSFVPTRRFAEVTAVTMAAALLGDLLLLPACLVLFERSSPKRKNPRS